jgi:aminopeptidase N
MRRAPRFAALAMIVSLGLGGCVTSATNTGGPAPSATATATAPTRPDPNEPGLSDPQTDPLYPAYGHADIDVLSYDLKLGWAPTTQTLTGTATLRIRPVVDLTTLRLDFLRSYTVDSATVDGVAEAAVHTGDHTLAIPTGHPLAKDGRTTLVVTYHGVPHDIPFPSNRGDAAEGLGLRPTATGEAWTMQEPYGADTWYPVNDHPSDEATYSIAVTVPTGWTAVASGTPGSVDQQGSTVTYHYVSTDPVASYVTTLAIGKYTKVTPTSTGVPVTCWLRTGRDEAFKPALERVPELLHWLTDHYGPYPFPTAGVVIVDSDSAMETQQMVTFGGQHDGAVDTEFTDEVLLHELSHQWFGDAVTPTNWLGLWLNEGWAMYSEMMWTIDEGTMTDARWVSISVRDDSQSRAEAGPPGHPKVNHFAEDNVYLGPAMMLREIRKKVGDQEFFAMARDWVQTQKDQSVDRAGFTAFVNRHTGQDLTALINQWLDSPTMPTPSP